MLRAVQPFHTTIDDVDRFVPDGELVADDDPIVAGREDLFEQVDTGEQTPRRRAAKPKG